MRAELLQSAVDNHGQVRLAMLIADVDRLFDAIVLERLRDPRGKLARLFLGRRISQITLDHDGDRIHGHDQKNDHDRDGDAAHVLNHLRDGELVAACRGGSRARGLPEKQKKADCFRSDNACKNSHGNSSKVFITLIPTGNKTERWQLSAFWGEPAPALLLRHKVVDNHAVDFDRLTGKFGWREPRRPRRRDRRRLQQRMSGCCMHRHHTPVLVYQHLHDHMTRGVSTPSNRWIGRLNQMHRLAIEHASGNRRMRRWRWRRLRWGWWFANLDFGGGRDDLTRGRAGSDLRNRV